MLWIALYTDLFIFIEEYVLHRFKFTIILIHDHHL
jgi:hypothetical protein